MKKTMKTKVLGQIVHSTDRALNNQMLVNGRGGERVEHNKLARLKLRHSPHLKAPTSLVSAEEDNGINQCLVLTSSSS